MKKIFSYALAAAAIFGMTSCAGDEPAPNNMEGDGVLFTINLPGGMKTRTTFGDTIRAELNNLQWAIYEVSGNTKTFVTSGQKVGFQADQSRDTVRLALVKGKTYQVAFYADNSENKFASFADGQVSVDYSKGLSNDVQEDVFVGNSEVITVTGASSREVTLKRPFAQLNWGTDDFNEPTIQKYLDSLTATVQVSQGLFGNYEVISETVSNPVDSIVTFQAVPYKEFNQATFPVKGYTLINMNYLLTGKGTIDCKLIFNNDIQPVVVNTASVNINYRTNIYGSLLTAPTQFNITVDPNWDGDIDMTWDGKTRTEPEGLTDPEVTDIHIKTPSDLAYIATYVNSGNNLKGKKLIIDTDMNLNNKEWTPIGSSRENSFQGTVEGQGNKIRNLYFSKGGVYVGLFGYTNGATISNLVFENAYINNTNATTDAGTAVVAGYPYQSDLSNITIKGEIAVTAYRYVGALAGHNISGIIDNISVVASPQSYVKATNNYVGNYATPNNCGGVVGYMAKGNYIVSNVVSNINVESATPGVGGVVGFADAGNFFVNCSSSGKVTLTNAATAQQAQAIGGIIGCNGSITGDVAAAITMTNCSFTGTLTSLLNGAPYQLPDYTNLYGINYRNRNFGYAPSNISINN